MIQCRGTVLRSPTLQLCGEYHVLTADNQGFYVRKGSYAANISSRTRGQWQ